MSNETWQVGDKFTYRYKAGGYFFQVHDGHRGVVKNIRTTGTGVDFYCLDCEAGHLIAFWCELEISTEVPM